MTSVLDLTSMASYRHAEYIAKARRHFPKITKGLDLAVGWKASRPDGTTHGGYFWPLVKHGVVKPVLHEATDWRKTNDGSCPSAPGDGLCLITAPEGVSHATSGTVRTLAESTVHVLVYAPSLIRSDTAGKGRAPWVIDVDSGIFTDMARLGLVADLSGANLSRADLYGADLSGANLSRANLSRADLSRADLSGANLSRANSDKWTVWPNGFVVPKTVTAR